MKATCPVCGKDFDNTPAHGGHHKRFCSPSCRKIYHCAANNARKHGAEPGPDGHALRPGRKCLVCGKEIDPRKPAHTVCCSLSCTLKRADRIRRGVPVLDAEFAEYVKARKAARLAKRRRVCACCGKEFVLPLNKTDAKFCSRACSNRTHVTTRRIARNITVSKSHRAGANLQFVKRREPVARGEASYDRVRAYIQLPAAERRARRDTLTAAELALAAKMWDEVHASRTTATNTLAH